MLLTGSLWGRPVWGVWWTWDPLLTTSTLLFVLYLGYLAIRRVPGTTEARARGSAIAAVVAFIDVPVVYFSVLWWNSLHQNPSVLDPVNGKTYVHGSMAWTLLLGFVSFTMFFAFLVVHRYRLSVLADLEEQEGLEAAVLERQSEVIR
jgi:heme exporter protein C